MNKGKVAPAIITCLLPSSNVFGKERKSNEHQTEKLEFNLVINL